MATDGQLAVEDVAAISPARFRSVLMRSDGARYNPADFQRRDFEATDPAWLELVEGKGRGGRFWIERTRGASKSTDVAIQLLWVLAFSARALSGVIAAGDQEQAEGLRDRIVEVIRANEWLRRYLDVKQYQVTNRTTGSKLDIISSDASTSYGLLLDFIVADEVSHWSARNGRELWVSLSTTAVKKKNCLLIVTTNAGWSDTWQAKLRDSIKGSRHWYFSEYTQPAPWHSPEALEASRQEITSDKEFRRLWHGQWVTAEGAEWPEKYFPDSIWFSDWPANLVLKVVTLDPTQGKKAKPGDYAALVMVGIDREARLWVKAELTSNLTSSEQAARLVEVCRAWLPDAVGIEVNAFQDLIKVEAERIAARAGYLFPCYGINNRQQKELRIVRLTPHLARGALRVMDDEGGRLLVQQLKNFSMKQQPGVHDDGPDALEQAIRLSNWFMTNKRPQRHEAQPTQRLIPMAELVG